MALYYVRHGETSWNALHKIQGRMDIPLSKTGKEQAKELKEILKDIHFDMVFSSPLLRAYETASIIVEDRNLNIIRDDRLLEMNYGDCEGMDHSRKELVVQRGMFASRYPNGESYMDVAKRVYSFLDEIKEKYRDKDILIVAHYGVGRILNSYFYSMTNEEFIGFKIGNCTYRKYEFKN